MKLESPLKEKAKAPGTAAVKRRKRSGLVRLAVVVVVLAAAVGGFFYWRAQQPNTAAAATINVPVTQGNLDINVESSGKVDAGKSATLEYETGGQVVEVLVKPGEKVEAGQPLVRLDDTDLQRKVDAAEADLKAAQAELNDLKKGPSASDVASAEADLLAAQAKVSSVRAGATAKELADAQADLRKAQANLESVRAGATAKELADAQAELAAAQAKLDAANAGATTKEIADAEADLKAAQAKLDALKTPPATAELAAAESDLKSARLNLDELKAGPDRAKVSEAQLKVTQAETALNNTRSSAGLDKQEAELALQKADRDMQEARRKFYTLAAELVDEQGNLREGLRKDQVDSYYEALAAMRDAEADYQKAGLALDAARQKEIADLAEAEAKLADAKNQLQDLLSGATAAELAAAQLAVDKAQKALDDLKAGAAIDDLAEAEAGVTKAQNKLDELRAGPASDELAEAQAAVVKAQTTLDELRAGPEAKPGAAADLADAQAEVDKAQNKLNDLRDGPAQADVAEALATVAQKEAALQKAKEPPTESELATAEQAVVQAQADLDDATAGLKKAVITAPYSGTIADVYAEPRATITTGDKAVDIYDSEGLHLALEVSEGDVEQVEPGQAAQITIDALPNKILTGTVTSVASVATSSQDAVTYKVEVEFDPGPEPVKLGMSANAVVRVDRRQGVIQVPNRAITTQGRFKTVQVLYGEEQTPITMRVETGATNGQMTEIVSCLDTGNQCLRSGDTVAMTMPTATGASNGRPGGDMVIFGPGGGGPPGGGGVRFTAPAP